MKLKLMGVLIAIGLSATAAVAKEKKNQTYWVVETNAITKDYSIIRFYNSSHQLVGEHRLNGVYLDVRKRRDYKRLEKLATQLTILSM